MNTPLRCRTLLYTPGDRPERYTKAWADGAADLVCADLEDAVAPGDKTSARAAVQKALNGKARAGCLRAVRINPTGTKFHEADLAMALAAGADVIVAPKCEDPAQLAALAARIEREATGATRLIAILETARGVVHARELCTVPGVAAVCFGAEDLAADVGMRRTPEAREVLAARQWVVLCATAAGIPAIDMITADYKDAARTSREAREARDFGFRGKMCIHPAQVPLIHAAFQPTAGELAWARKVLAAVKKAGVGKGGVITVDGTMVDIPVIQQAERILADAG